MLNISQGNGSRRQGWLYVSDPCDAAALRSDHCYVDAQ